MGGGGGEGGEKQGPDLDLVPYSVGVPYMASSLTGNRRRIGVA